MLQSWPGLIQGRRLESKQWQVSKTAKATNDTIPQWGGATTVCPSQHPQKTCFYCKLFGTLPISTN